MAVAETISIDLQPEMAAQVHEAIEAGEYSSSSEVVHDALCDWTRKRQTQQNGVAELQQIWQEAPAGDSPGIPADGVLDELERKYQARADATGKVV